MVLAENLACTTLILSQNKPVYLFISPGVITPGYKHMTHSGSVEGEEYGTGVGAKNFSPLHTTQPKGHYSNQSHWENYTLQRQPALPVGRQSR